MIVVPFTYTQNETQARMKRKTNRNDGRLNQKSIKQFVNRVDKKKRMNGHCLMSFWTIPSSHFSGKESFWIKYAGFGNLTYNRKRLSNVTYSSLTEKEIYTSNII